MLDKIKLEYIPYLVLAALYIFVNPLRNFLSRNTWYLIAGLAYAAIFALSSGIMNLSKDDYKNAVKSL